MPEKTPKATARSLSVDQTHGRFGNWPAPPTESKAPAAVAAGKLGGTRHDPAKAKKLTPRVLMIFEDLQWIDPTSLESLDMAVDRIKTLPVLLLKLASELIRAGKLGTPVTLKTFLPPISTSPDSQLINIWPVSPPRRPRSSMLRITARTIYDLSIRRGLIVIGEESRGRGAPALQACRERSQRHGLTALWPGVSCGPRHAGRAYLRDGKLSGLATGLPDLDADMGGLHPSDLIILAGRPGMGKTAIATNIAYNVAKAWRGERRADGHMAALDGGNPHNPQAADPLKFAIFLNGCSHNRSGPGKAECGASAVGGWRERFALR